MAAHNLARPGIRILWLIPAMIAGILVLGALSPLVAAGAPASHFSVSPDDPPDLIWAREFSPNTPVTVSMDDPGTGVGWDHTQGASTDENGNFDLASEVDFSAGWTIEIIDGTVTKTLTVTSIWFDGFDDARDSCWGYATPSTLVNVWFWDEDQMQHLQRDTTAASNGYWFVDFGVAVGSLPQDQAGDIKVTTTVTASEADGDGDATQVNGHPINPIIAVFPEEDTLNGWAWPANVDVVIAIDDPSTTEPVDYTTSGHTDGDGNLGASTAGEYDIQPGFSVTATYGGSLTTQTTVTALMLGGADPATDAVWGKAEPESWLWVDASSGEHSQVQADVDGMWWLDTATDLTPGTYLTVYQEDDDVDRTQINYYIRDPRMAADREQDRVNGWDWPADTALLVTVNSMWTTNVTTDEWGNFDVFLGPAIDLTEGSIVSVADGTTVKTTTITALTITRVDPAQDSISGTAARDTEVFVWVWGPQPTMRRVMADGVGNWVADFTEPDGDNPAHDLVSGDQGDVNQEDADGDQTRVDWRIANPNFGADPDVDEVFGGDFAAGSSVTISIDDPGTGATPDYLTTTDTDQWGNFGTGFQGEFDLLPGHEVAVTDGTATKDHTVAGVTVSGVDVELETVSGTGPPSSWVWVTMWGDNASRHVETDSSGNWTADFSVADDGEWTVDVVPGAQGEATWHDAENDFTRAMWRVAAPAVGVDPERDEVWGGDFAAWSTVAVTIDDPGTGDDPDYSATLDTDDMGNFGTGTGDVFDIQAGFVVTADQDAIHREHTVTGLVVTDIDIDLDRVSGVAAPNAWVDVDVYNMANRHVQADGSGNWMADFTTGEEWEQLADIGLGTEGEARENDDDGDHTRVVWRVPNPHFGVDPERDELWGMDMAARSTVTIEIDDPDTGVSPDYETTADTDDWGNYGIGLAGEFDIQPGFYATVDDGTIHKEHTVTGLVVTDVDVDLDRVSGVAAPDAWVDVDVYGVASRRVQADGSGDWMADFATGEEWEGTADIGLGTEGEAREADEDWDHTRATWRIPNPSVGVDPERDEVWGGDFVTWSSVTVTIDDLDTPETPDYSATLDTDDWGNFGTWTGDEIDIQPGFYVMAEDASTYKEHTVTELVVTDVDIDADRVSGTAEPDSWVDVNVYGMASRHVQADGSGDWMADFANGEEWEGTADIGLGTEGEALQFDEDTDHTRDMWRVPNPQVGVDPERDELWGADMTAFASVTFTIDDPDTPALPDYETTIDADDWGSVGIWTGDEIDIQPGFDVTIDDDVIFKEHTVTDVVVTEIDPDTDRIYGTATPGAWIDIDVYGVASRHVQADGSGDWIADFSTGQEWEGNADITPGTEGEARESDEDWDYTRDWWRVMNPNFTVEWNTDSIWGGDFAARWSVQVMVDDWDVPGEPDYQTTADTDEWGNFWTEISAEFDIDAGQHVHVYDGTTYKMLEVLYVEVTEIDPDLDTISGMADPFSDVWVSLNDGQTGKQVQADETGFWIADFSTGAPWEVADLGPGSQGAAQRFDDDGDCSQWAWHLAYPRLAARPVDNNIAIWEFPALVDVNVTIDDLETPANPDYDALVETNEWGDAELWIDPREFDLAAGHVVTAEYGTVVKEHTVTTLSVTSVDADTDTISGTAYDDRLVMLHNWSYEDEWAAEPAPGGAWSLDLMPIDPGNDGNAEQWDDDGDATEVYWHALNPGVAAAIPDGGLWGWDWTPLADVTVTVDNPATGTSPDFTEVLTADGWGSFNLDPSLFPMQAGFTITADEGSTHKELVVSDLVVSLADPDTDHVSGTVSPDGTVWVDAWTETDGQTRETDSHAGTWDMSFADWWAMGMPPMDLVPGTDGQAYVYDEDGDQTVAYWHIPNPEFRASPCYEEISGNDWAAYVALLITYDDPATPGSPDVTTSTVTDGWGEFAVPMAEEGVDIREGDIVTVSDGDTVKTHVVTSLRVTDVDTEADTVSGTTSPNAWVWVYIDEVHENGGRYVQADPGGAWTADFTVGSMHGDPYDIVDGTTGGANEEDEDRDETWVCWSAGSALFTVVPADDAIWGGEWALDGLATVTIDDPDTGASPDFTLDSIATDFYTGNFWVPDVGYDITAGDVITVSDGTTVKSHTVTALAVTTIDLTADTVEGTSGVADSVFVGRFSEGWMGEIEASWPGVGEWIADFSLMTDPVLDLNVGISGAARQEDADGDNTLVAWSTVIPEAFDDSDTTAEDEPLIVAAPGVLDNDTYNAGQTQVEVAAQPAHGDATIDAATGAWTYTPDSNWNGTDSFTYVLTEGGVDSDPATVTITVTAANDSPVAVADSASVAQDSVLNVAAPGVLGNDSDIDGGTITASVVADVTHGDLTLNADGGYTYTPTAGWFGTDTFTYRAFDGTDYSNTVTVTITVTPPNDPPVAVADNASVTQDRVLNVAAPGVLGNDTDADSDPLEAHVVAQPAHGTLTLNTNGGYTYTPTAGWFGTDTFTYRAFDGTDYSNTVTVTITVTPAEFTEVPIAGDNRFETSVSISEQAFPDGADWVVIATGRNWPDALGGSALAGALDGPILLTDTSMIPGGVVAEIERLEATHAIILGGTSAVAASVETALNSMLGNANVERIAGATRYLTADAVGARTIAELGSAYDGTALMATGANYPDALAAAPLSAGLHWPLFLTKPTGIAATTKSAMSGVSEVLVLGGTSAVPGPIETSLNTTYGNINVTRLAGADRYATAVVVATHGVANGLEWNCLAIATGENFPDALAGGVLQGRDGSVMLLTKSAYLNANVAAVLEENKATIHEVRYLGGTGAVSQAVRDSVAAVLE